MLKPGYSYLADQNKNLASAPQRQVGFSTTSRFLARINEMNNLFRMVDALGMAANKAVATNDNSVRRKDIDGFSSFDEKLTSLAYRTPTRRTKRPSSSFKAHRRTLSAPAPTFYLARRRWRRS
jgi:hypothetical protein